MIPNWQMALKDLASIKVAVDLSDWTIAQKIREDQLDYATFPLFGQLEAGQAPATVDARIGEVRVDIERLRRALEVRDRTAANCLLVLIEQKVRALVSEPAVA
jgi:hypothetical protein